jgi:lipoprotein-anchoring transpeptidase ErfK/SrfK
VANSRFAASRRIPPTITIRNSTSRASTSTITKDSYGIHGTPDPERIGKTYSHGCIRLTNWDALDLAKRVRKGTRVAFVDEPSAPPTARGPGEARGRK